MKKICPQVLKGEKYNTKTAGQKQEGNKDSGREGASGDTEKTGQKYTQPSPFSPENIFISRVGNQVFGRTLGADPAINTAKLDYNMSDVSQCETTSQGLKTTNTHTVSTQLRGLQTGHTLFLSVHLPCSSF